MGDDFVTRLHENPYDTLTTRLRAYYSEAETRAEAADRIEQLEADLFALAEMVRVISPYVERDINGDVGVVAGRNFYSNSNWTEADAERFQRVLDKLDIFAATYEPEDGER